jgi:starch synthase
MESKRILYVSQEIHPYLPENEISKPSLYLPKKMNQLGHQVRIFMPRYGLINERRHQLHEVIRLSGINIIVNDMDQPLIIKVASVPSARLQVYFIDNEEFFKRKATFSDEDDIFYSDNDQRAIFFCRGVIETVRKLGWAPDIIHCHGWLASFFPLYIKRFHDDDPLFADSKIVFSAYNHEARQMPETLTKNLEFDGIEAEDLARYENADLNTLYKAASHYADAVVYGSKDLSQEVKDYIENNVSNILPHTDGDDMPIKVAELYEQITVEEEVA